MSEIREARLFKANTLIKRGLEPCAETFKISHSTKFLTENYGYLDNGQEFNLKVSLAGRVLSKRVMGKIAFFTINDQEGKIQLYLEKKIIDDFQINSKLLSFEDLSLIHI